MIINFFVPGAARAGLVAGRAQATTFVVAATEREPLRNPLQLICRRVADPASGALHAVWHPETQATVAAGLEEPDRLCLAA